jgi:hypothetical protein
MWSIGVITFILLAGCVLGRCLRGPYPPPLSCRPALSRSLLVAPSFPHHSRVSSHALSRHACLPPRAFCPCRLTLPLHFPSFSSPLSFPLATLLSTTKTIGAFSTKSKKQNFSLRRIPGEKFAWTREEGNSSPYPSSPPPLLVLGFGQSHRPSFFRLPSSLSTLSRPPRNMTGRTSLWRLKT